MWWSSCSSKAATPHAGKAHEHFVEDAERERNGGCICDFGTGRRGSELPMKDLSRRGSALPGLAEATPRGGLPDQTLTVSQQVAQNYAGSRSVKEAHPPRTRLFDLWQATTWKAPSSSSQFRPDTGQSSTRSRLSSAELPFGAMATESLSRTPAGGNSCGTRGGLLDSLTNNMLSIAPSEEDGMVSILPPKDQLMLLDGASRHHCFQPRKHEKRDLEYTDKFKDICTRKYTTLILAWRLLLDKEGQGRVAFPNFCTSVKSIGFREPKRLWKVLNTRNSAFLTLDEWDPVSFRNLYEFRTICWGQFGGMDTAFNFGMDKTGSRTITMPELERFCDDQDFSGDVKVLFDSLDMHRHGFITRDELEFLEKWEGERHGHHEQHYDFQLVRLNNRKREAAERKAERAAEQKAKLASLAPPPPPTRARRTSVSHQLTSEILGRDQLTVQDRLAVINYIAAGDKLPGDSPVAGPKGDKSLLGFRERASVCEEAVDE